jgi:hypothetical protein
MSISEVSANLWNHVYCSRSTFSKWLPTSAASQFQFADTRVAGALSRARICTKAGAATARASQLNPSVDGQPAYPSLNARFAREFAPVTIRSI